MRNATGPGATRGAARAATVNATRHARAVGNVLNARAVNRTLHNANALRDPASRARLTSRVATAGWQGHHGWWRHRHGGFGWVGPVFWPFALYDIYDYSLWGPDYGLAFWDYGYPDIYAGIFSPYGYDDLAGYSGYLPRTASKGEGPYASANPSEGGETGLAQMCGEDSRTIAGFPIDAIQKALQPDDAQRAALDDLANASMKAAADLKAACPTDIALTAPRRLDLMQQRIEAMIAAVNVVQPPLDRFYGMLSDEQKARFNALAAEQRRGGRSAATATACADTGTGFAEWPASAIDETVKPNDDQRRKLQALQDAAGKAADMLKASCPSDATTPPARLAAVGKRLDTMLQAVNTVRPALNDFYASLSDEQKANFDAIGPQRIGAQGRQASNESSAPVRRRHHGSVEHMIQRMMMSVIR